MKKLIVILLIIFTSCLSKEKVDLIVYNANIYTVDENFNKAEAIAIKDGKFVEVGTSEAIQKKYSAKEFLDAKGQTLLPGFIDAHCHFYGLGLAEQKVRLEATKSFDEIIERLVDFQNKKNLSFITGRGWDQNDWDVKKLPTKVKLSYILFFQIHQLPLLE